MPILASCVQPTLTHPVLPFGFATLAIKYDRPDLCIALISEYGIQINEVGYMCFCPRCDAPSYDTTTAGWCLTGLHHRIRDSPLLIAAILANKSDSVCQLIAAGADVSLPGQVRENTMLVSVAL
jgi:hypothetical protein